MRQINEELTGIEVSDLVANEQEGDIVDEQNGFKKQQIRQQNPDTIGINAKKSARTRSHSENQGRESGFEVEQTEKILAEFAEQDSNSLDEHLLDGEGNLKAPSSHDAAKPGPQQKEKDDARELSEYTVEQVEYTREDDNEQLHRQHENNLNKDKSGALESQVDFQAASAESQKWMENLEFILDIPLQIDIQLGQAQIPLKEVLELSSGSLIKLNKSENAPVELLINGKLVAEGQIVVTEENTLGVQVTSIVNRVERIRSLR